MNLQMMLGTDTYLFIQADHRDSVAVAKSTWWNVMSGTVAHRLGSVT